MIRSVYVHQKSRSSNQVVADSPAPGGAIRSLLPADQEEADQQLRQAIEASKLTAVPVGRSFTKEDICIGQEWAIKLIRSANPNWVNEELSLVSMPGDGNCLFQAFLYNMKFLGLEGVNPNSPILTPADVRRDIAKWMRENRVELCRLVGFSDDAHTVPKFAMHLQNVESNGRMKPDQQFLTFDGMVDLVENSERRIWNISLIYNGKLEDQTVRIDGNSYLGNERAAVEAKRQEYNAVGLFDFMPPILARAYQVTVVAIQMSHALDERTRQRTLDQCTYTSNPTRAKVYVVQSVQQDHYWTLSKFINEPGTSTSENHDDRKAESVEVKGHASDSSAAGPDARCSTAPSAHTPQCPRVRKKKKQKRKGADSVESLSSPSSSLPSLSPSFTTESTSATGMNGSSLAISSSSSAIVSTTTSTEMEIECDVHPHVRKLKGVVDTTIADHELVDRENHLDGAISSMAPKMGFCTILLSIILPLCLSLFALHTISHHPVTPDLLWSHPYVIQEVGWRSWWLGIREQLELDLDGGWSRAHETLGLDPINHQQYSIDDIRRARRKLALIFHPDKLSTDLDVFWRDYRQQKFQSIQKAYERICEAKGEKNVHAEKESKPSAKSSRKDQRKSKPTPPRSTPTSTSNHTKNKNKKNEAPKPTERSRSDDTPHARPSKSKLDDRPEGTRAGSQNATKTKRPARSDRTVKTKTTTQTNKPHTDGGTSRTEPVAVANETKLPRPCAARTTGMDQKYTAMYKAIYGREPTADDSPIPIHIESVQSKHGHTQH